MADGRYSVGYMSVIPWQMARELIAVNPATGMQIEHVRACDPERMLIEVWCTYPCVPGYESVWTNSDGTTEERNYMLLQLTDPVTGERTYMSRVEYIDYDLVQKYTGEVLYEVRQPGHLDPEEEAPVEEPETAGFERGNLQI